MKNSNRLLYILIIILAFWCAILSSRIANDPKRDDSMIVNQYEVDGFSTDFTKVIDQVKPGVVTISADGNILSGFVYRQEGDEVYILSAYHGLSNVNTINVLFGSSYQTAGELVGHDVYTDLAVIRIIVPYLIEPLKLSDATLLHQGEFLLTIGTPVSLDYAGSVELCMVSGTDMQIENNILVHDERHSYYLDVIQLSSSLTSGYSGGPLFNMNGEVVGMNTMSLSTSLSFALTANETKLVADQLIAKQPVDRKLYGFKGTYLKDMYNYEKANLNIGIETINGIYVQKVKENSPAWLAGIRPGDVITKIGNEEMSDINSYLKAVYSPLEEIGFEYIRNGETIVSVPNND